MRYRLHIPPTEYIGAAIAFVDGMLRILFSDSKAHNTSLSGWHLLLSSLNSPYFLLSTPLLLLLHSYYSYVELTLSSIEYQHIWRHRSIPYTQIERIRLKPSGGSFSGIKGIEIHATGMKKLILNLEKPAEFVAEIKQYAPLAGLEENAKL